MLLWGGGTGGLNLPLTVPFNPGSTLFLLPPASLRFFLIAKYCTMLCTFPYFPSSRPLFSPLPYTSRPLFSPLPYTSRPLFSPLPYTSLPVFSPLPYTSRPLFSPLPYTSRPLFSPLPFTSRPLSPSTIPVCVFFRTGRKISIRYVYRAELPTL